MRLSLAVFMRPLSIDGARFRGFFLQVLLILVVDVNARPFRQTGDPATLGSRGFVVTGPPHARIAGLGVKDQPILIHFGGAYLHEIDSLQ